MRGSSERKAVAKALASGKSARKASAKKKGAKPWNASWAACGDGCLDKLVVSVKKEPPTTRPLRGGLVEFPAVPTASSAGRSSAGVSGGSGGSGGSGAPLMPLVLLGLLSGSPTRRAMLRCTWMQVPRFHESVRLLFVVGSNAPGPAVADELRVNVTEGERMRAFCPPGRTCAQKKFDPNKRVQTGSVTTYWKLADFFAYAATQPEPMIARGDDDVLISPRMLLAHARLLLSLPGLPAAAAQPPAAADTRRGDAGAPQGVPYVFAGVFEWYSWRVGTLHSTGFGFSAGAARKRTRAPWRNCSADGRKAPYKGAPYTIMPTPRDPCVGPIAFAKGPLMLLSSATVRWLVSSPAFLRDVATARAMAAGRIPAYVGPGSGRIDDDVQLGYWLSKLPQLHYVTFRRYMAWHDRWKGGVTDMLPRLLLAHKVPWAQFGDLLNRTEAIWSASPHAMTRLRCQGPPCEDCAHIQGQRACAIDIELAPPAEVLRGGTCWPTCKFAKGSAPTVPQDCWRRPARPAVA